MKIGEAVFKISVGGGETVGRLDTPPRCEEASGLIWNGGVKGRSGDVERRMKRC